MHRKRGFHSRTRLTDVLVVWIHSQDAGPICKPLNIRRWGCHWMRGGDQGGTSDFRQRVSTSFPFIYVQLCSSLYFISLGHALSWVAGENCKYMETLPFYASTYWGSHRPTRVASFGLCLYVFGGNSRIHKKILPIPGANQKYIWTAYFRFVCIIALLCANLKKNNTAEMK